MSSSTQPASMTIKRKLYLSYGLLLTLVLGMGAVSMTLVNHLGAAAKDLGGESAQQLAAAGALNGDSSDTLVAQRGLLLSAVLHDQSHFDEDLARYVENEENSRKSIAAMRSGPLPQKSIEMLEQTVRDLDTAAPVFERFLVEVRAGHAAEATAIHEKELSALLLKIDDVGTDLLTLQQQQMAQASAEAQSKVTFGYWLMTLFIGACCGVGVLLVLVIRKLNLQLEHSVADLSDSAVQIASAASQIATTSQTLASSSSQQAAMIEETSSASSQINSMAKRNTENSFSAAGIVTSSQEGFAKANNSLSEMVTAMYGINSSSQKISKIIKVIDEIAFQTNILALNAAVEAARAGEAGMGFAVVADEVRNLAQRCAQAAQDTTGLIEDSIQKAAGGMLKVEQVAVAIREVTGQSSKIKLLVDEINQGSTEQSRGIDQIVHSISQMEHTTQSNAASSEESAAAAQQLSAQAEVMQQVVSQLRSMIQKAA